MKLSQFILGSLLVFFSVLGLYAGLTTQPKNSSDWFAIASSLILLYLAIVYLRADLNEKKGDTSRVKGNILDILQIDVNIDVETKNLLRIIVAFVIIVLDIYILQNFHSDISLLVSLKILAIFIERKILTT